MHITIYDTMDWIQNKLYNPITKRRLKLNSKIYNLFETKYNEFFPDNYSYIDSIEDRDPITFEMFWVEENGKKKIIYNDLLGLKLYKDSKGLVHCFEINTLEYMKHYNINYHPTTKDTLPDHLFDNIISNIKINQNISHKAINVFNNFTNISIFIDSKYFIKLSNISLNKLYYETREFYIHNIGTNIINIFNKSIAEYNTMSVLNKQHYILDCYDSLLKPSINTQDMYMTYYIILGGLSIVIPEVKDLYPDIVMN